MTRQTSREAYEHLVKNRLLRGKQALVIGQLLISGPATSGEVVAALQAEHLTDFSLRNVNAWRARFTELQHRGLIVECGQRRSKETKRLALVWRFTGRTKPLVVKRGRGAKAWKTLAMDLWEASKDTDFDSNRAGYADRIRALGGKP